MNGRGMPVTGNKVRFAPRLATAANRIMAATPNVSRRPKSSRDMSAARVTLNSSITNRQNSTLAPMKPSSSAAAEKAARADRDPRLEHVVALVERGVLQVDEGADEGHQPLAHVVLHAEPDQRRG